MKNCLMLLLLLPFGASVGCVPVTSGSSLTPVVVEKPPVPQTPASSGDATRVAPVPAFTPTSTLLPAPTDSSTPSPNASFTPTNSPLLPRTSTPTPLVTPTPAPSASFTPASTPTPIPTVMPTAVPSATPAPVQPPTLAPPAVPTAVNSAGASAQVERGFEIYKQQYCGLCHQLDAAGTAGQFGPSHNGIGTRAEQRIHEARYTGTATTAAVYLHESIVSPKVYTVAGYENTQHQMPAYVHLSEADVDALVQMLLQQR
ncbi:MAG: c-type cytochrome [Anaerolineae bacterium]|nr:c-type cytochrome [Anaerolineae bacterium]